MVVTWVRKVEGRGKEMDTAGVVGEEERSKLSGYCEVPTWYRALLRATCPGLLLMRTFPVQGWKTEV